MTSLFVHQV